MRTVPLVLASLLVAATASAQQPSSDVTPPVLASATLSPAPDGNGVWRRSGPVTLSITATDNVAVARVEYSLDNGRTFVAAPATAGPSVTVSVPISQQGNTQVRYRAVDRAGNYSVGDAALPPPPAGGRGRGAGPGGGGGGGGRGNATPPVTLAASVPPASTAIRLTNIDGRLPGDVLVIGEPGNQETVVIDRLVSDAGAGDANVTLKSPLRNMHAAASPVFLSTRTVAVPLDTEAPRADWPAIAGNAVRQSQTLTPALSDGQGSGGVGIWRMEVDGTHVYPFPIALNTLTTGAHTQLLTLRDIAGNSATYVRAFVVTTSFDDLDTVLTQYAEHALSTTLAVAGAAGDTSVRVTSPFGFRAGQTLVIGSGAERETVTVASVPSPPPPQQGANLVLAAPLRVAHAAGAATPVSHARPRLAAGVVSTLRGIVQQAGARNAAGDKAATREALQRFIAAVGRDVTPANPRGVERLALTSAARTLLDELDGKPAPVVANALVTRPERPSLRVFTDPMPPVRTPGATYKVLVSGQTNAFRHEHIVDTEAMVQKLGAANGFDVDIWDRRGTAGPGRQIPAGVSLTASPFADLATLRRYKTVVLASTVGREPNGTFTPEEYANFQAYIRGGGGVVAIHGATDAYQNVPWWVDLVGGGFSGHGGNVVGIQPDCMSCGEVELIKADRSHPATQHLPPTLAIHDELYNTSRNPVELGLVHPLVYENEATLVGQINYNPGPLMNSDRHAMVWCRNFEGGRSFTSVIGHNWELTHQAWYQQLILKGIQTTAGVVPANCVTYAEVAAMVPANSPLSAALAAARAEYDRGNYAATVPHLERFLQQAASNAALRAKGIELMAWMKELN